MKKVLMSIGLGLLKSTPIVGNIVTEVRANKADSITGEGKMNYTRLATYIGFGGLMIAKLLGYITNEQIHDVINFTVQTLGPGL